MVGLSDKHASTTPLVLNPSTGSITTKFHVVFDDWFATVSSDPNDFPPFGSTPWNDLFGSNSEYHSPDDDDEQGGAGLIDSTPPQHVQRHLQDVSATFERLQPAVPLNIPPPATMDPSNMPPRPAPVDDAQSFNPSSLVVQI